MSPMSGLVTSGLMVPPVPPSSPPVVPSPIEPEPISQSVTASP
jgi:hypothetical protein